MNGWRVSARFLTDGAECGLGDGRNVQVAKFAVFHLLLTSKVPDSNTNCRVKVRRAKDSLENWGAAMRWNFSIAREVRAELDSAVVPSVRGQPGASVSVHSGVQPWELPSPVMSAQGGQALVAAERAGQADQDGRPSGAALPSIDLFRRNGPGCMSYSCRV